MPTQRRNVAAAADDHDDALASVPAQPEEPATRPPIRRSALPVVLQFPLVTLLSFVTASLGYSLLAELTKGELGKVSRSQDTWQEIALMSSWRVTELALAWFGKLDGLDVALLDLLSHGPHFYLVSNFYSVSALTAVSALLIDVTSAAAPFYLLRPLSAVHTPSAAARLPNRELLDVGTQLYTAALSTGIYTVVLVLSSWYLLPRALILHFRGVHTIEPAYLATFASVLPVTAVFGVAASTFIFAPFATTGHVMEDDKNAAFDPVEATLGESVRWRAWGYTAKTKVVIRRTAAVVVLAAVSTYLAGSQTLPRVESPGAATYAGVWASAALLTGVGLGFVGSV